MTNYPKFSDLQGKTLTRAAQIVIWNDGSYSGECACGEFIRQGADCSVNQDGEVICGYCADEIRKEMQDDHA